MSPLESRKRLLIAESELNRASLVEDLAAVTAEVRTLAAKARSLAAITTSGVGLLSGLGALAAAPATKPGTGARPSWVRTLLHGADLAARVWSAVHPPDR